MFRLVLRVSHKSISRVTLAGKVIRQLFFEFEILRKYYCRLKENVVPETYIIKADYVVEANLESPSIAKLNSYVDALTSAMEPSVCCDSSSFQHVGLSLSAMLIYRSFQADYVGLSLHVV